MAVLEELVDDIEVRGPRVTRRSDPFAPVLYTSSVLTVSQEQEDAVRNVLLLCSSDTRFAQKAADALRIILLGGVNGGVVPTVTSLVPNTAVAGAPPPPLKVRVLGTGFDTGTKILVDGVVVNTTYVSATEVFTNVSLGTAVVGVKQVSVQSGFGALSNTMPFTVTAV